MESILPELINTGTLKSKAEEKYCLDALESILQSETTDYTNYFSSRAESGSIVEEIAEVDAQMAALEKQVRTLLIENKDYVTKTILNKSRDTIMLEEVGRELEQLWELNSGNSEDKEAAKTASSGASVNESDSLLEEFLNETTKDGSDASSKTKKGGNTEDDEFHRALQTLRQRVMTKNEMSKVNSSASLTSIFENLTSITDLMELPSLAQTCIKTGHYQEAIMLYTHTTSLKAKFPDSSIVSDISASVQDAVGTTMLTGLIKLLSTNLTINSIKKILQYLVAIPPFSENDNNDALLIVYLAARLKFIEDEIDSYSSEEANANNSLLEISAKRQIEVIREHIYMSLTVYSKIFDVLLTEVVIALDARLRNTESVEKGEEKIEETEEKIEEKQEETTIEEEKEEQTAAPEGTEEDTTKDVDQSNTDDKDGTADDNQKDNTEVDIAGESNPPAPETTEATEKNSTQVTPSRSDDTTPVKTNPLMLNFVNDCLNFLLEKLQETHRRDSSIINNSTCLQLVYCSFRLNDLNRNYHHLFLNKILEKSLFTAAQVHAAVVKRTELASKYSFT